MSCFNLIKKLLVGLLFVFGFSYSFSVTAGFLDMPEISETPQLRGKTMVRDLDIPSVRERNPDPKSGPRLAIKEFRIQGLVEYPELGITREVINKMVEHIRRDLMAEGKLLSSGYTIKELGQLSDLLIDIEDETIKRHVTPLEVQRLVWLVRDQRSKRGIHLGQIEAIADQITRFYRERGFILAKAYIPKQEVREGIVSLTLLLGMLGEVNVKGNELYAESDIAEVFDDMLTKPITTDRVEESLYLLNDYPGLTVDGYFEPGYQIGDSRLTVNVKQEKRFSSNIRVDNHGTDDTGLYRFYADIQANNTLGLADSINVSVLQAESPSNTTYWRLFYQMNLFSPRWKFNVGSSRNQFVVDKSSDNDIGLRGSVDILDTGITYILKRSRAANYNLQLKYEEMKSELTLGENSQPGEKLNSASLIYNYDSLNEKEKSLHQGNVKIRSYRYEYFSNPSTTQKPEVTYLTSDYTYLAFVKVPFFDATSRFIFRANAQYAGTQLSSLLRSSLGGPTRARAYQSNLFTADDVIYLGIDWIFNSPDFLSFNITDNINLQEFIKPFIFMDYATGVQNQATAVDVKAEVANWGLGFQFSHGQFKGNLQFAFPSHQKFSEPGAVNYEKENRIIFDFQYSF